MPNNTPPKPSRNFACVECHRAKVKCEGKFPCSRCLRLGKECIPHESRQGRRTSKRDIDGKSRINTFNTSAYNNNYNMNVTMNSNVNHQIVGGVEKIIGEKIVAKRLLATGGKSHFGTNNVTF